MLSKVRVKVYGKINLSLNITGVSGGFHMLDTVVASVSIADIITVRDRLDDKINLIFNADFTPQDNTVIKAVNELRKSFGPFGADIVVDKNLPLAGGMGGSSADAAGVIAALTRLFDFDKRGLNARKVCSAVGADVFYMLSGGYARLKGIGDEITTIDCNREMGLVFICTDGILTSKVYALYDKLGGDRAVDNDLLIRSLINGDKFPLGNMLFRSASSLNDSIKRNAEVLSGLGLTPNMTGSGSTVYAFTDDPIGDANRLREKGLNAFYAFTKPSGIEFL